MITLEKKQVLAERLSRQRFINPIESFHNEQEFMQLFKLLQPVSPVHNTRPGDPPKLVHRASFPDEQLTGELRENNRLIKGRFCGGRIGYVLEEDLPVYAAAFRKPLTKSGAVHEDVWQVIKYSGGISKDQLKQELQQYSASEITKALQDLHEAFLIYEHQPDTDWDTGWFDFETEWFKVETGEDQFARAASKVIVTFIRSMAFATAANIKSWSQFPLKTIQKAVQTLLAEQVIVEAEAAELGKGFICSDDIHQFAATEVPSAVFMLDRSDIIVRAHMDELLKQYKGLEVLQYLLIDGEFKGAVLGHWRIGPYPVDNIVVELPLEQIEARRNEIIEAVTKIYEPERHPIHKYSGIEQVFQ